MTCPCGRWTPAGDVSGEVRAELAEVLAAHQLVAEDPLDGSDEIVRCYCLGWELGSLGTHLDHQADTLAPLLARREAEARAAGLTEARRAILGDESTIWLKERGVNLYRFAHRDERIGCSITETYVKESDVARAFDAELAARSDQDGAS